MTISQIPNPAAVTMVGGNATGPPGAGMMFPFPVELLRVGFSALTPPVGDDLIIVPVQSDGVGVSDLVPGGVEVTIPAGSVFPTPRWTDLNAAQFPDGVLLGFFVTQVGSSTPGGNVHCHAHWREL